MNVTALFYKLFQFKTDLGAILKRYCCNGNVLFLNSYRLIQLPRRIIIFQIFYLNYVFYVNKSVGSDLKLIL